VADELLEQAAASDGIERQGLVLAGLTRLKQVCNHPAHYLADGTDLAGRSGKLARCEELIDAILDTGEKALLFTQYTNWGERLAVHLARRCGRNPLWLHGGLGRSAHRLGQLRCVHVHKLVCGGTVEEGIDALIRGKRELAEREVASGEQALSRLSTDELRELIRLRPSEGRR